MLKIGWNLSWHIPYINQNVSTSKQDQLWNIKKMTNGRLIWTEGVFITDAIVNGNPTTYKIKDKDNEPVKGTFYEQELQLIVESKMYCIKKVIPMKKEGNRDMYSGKVIQIK